MERIDPPGSHVSVGNSGSTEKNYYGEIDWKVITVAEKDGNTDEEVFADRNIS
jgi:hypothetical protein